MLQQLWNSVFGGDATPDPGSPPRGTEIVVSLPVPVREPLAARAPRVRSTAEVFRRLISEAKQSIKIFSPYVDPTFTGMAQEARAPIQVVTTLREARMKSSPVLERFATTRPLAVRYLHEKQARSQMFQLHAKMILSDRAAAYVGSANFTDTSLHYNFELGLRVEDPALIAQLHSIFDYLFEFAARPA